MLELINKWRRDFGMRDHTTATPEDLLAAKRMIIEEANEIFHADSDENLMEELADLYVVAEQLRDLLPYELQPVLEAKLKANYTKAIKDRETAEQMAASHALPMEVREHNGLFFLFHNGKLQKPQTYEKAKIDLIPKG